MPSPEPAALFLQQEIEHHLLIVVNIEALRVDFREHIERPIWLHAGDARDIVDQLPRAVTLFVQAASGTINSLML